MPSLQNLVLTDRAATPVNHTLTPRDVIGNVGTVVETSGVPLGNNQVSISMRQQPSGKYLGRLHCAFPVVQTETINGIPKPVLVRVARVKAEFEFDSSSTEQERKDAVGMFASALDPSKVLVNDALVKLQGVWG